MSKKTQYDVFLSHNSADKEAMEIIAHRLREEAKLHPFLDRWHLIPGEPWQEALEEALAESATVAVFVGPSGISPWHNEEMRAALDHAVRTHDDYRVIPVLLPGATEEAVAGFLARRTWVDFRPGLDDADAFARLVAGILGQPPEDAGPFTLPDEPEPYPGLLPFTPQQADLFFGRTEEQDRLLARVRESPFVAIVGASGSGKSSLVLAGLLPALDKDWHALTLVPGARPLRALADQLVTLLPPESRLRLADDLETRLADRKDGLSTAVSTLLADRSDITTLLIVVDQFEELFTQVGGTPEDGRRQQRGFIANLVDAVQTSDGGVRVMLTLRADFVRHCLDFPDLRDLLEPNQLLLGPMGEKALREAIVKPAQAVGAMFEKGLVGRLLDDMRDQPAALPLMGFALAQLWRKRHGVWLTHAAYEEIGGIGGALNQVADTMYSRLNEKQQQMARNLFVRLVSFGEGASDTRRRARRDELRLVGATPEEVDKLIGILSYRDVRLIAADVEAVELAHEALIEQWGQLRKWLEEDREVLRIHRRLTQTAHEWEESDQDESYLYQGGRLAEAEEWAGIHSEEMSVLERQFLDASLGLRERDRAARERLRRSITAAGLAAAFILALIALFAGWQWRLAERQGRIALARQLAAQASVNLESQPQLSLLLAVEAISSTLEVDGVRIPAAEESLRQVLAATGGIPLDGRWDKVTAITFSPDGRWLAAAGHQSSDTADNTAILWNMADTSATPIVLGKNKEEIRAITFSRDGRWLVIGRRDAPVELWDVNNPTANPIILSGHEHGVEAIAFSRDGHWLAAAVDCFSYDECIRVWDVDNPMADPVVLRRDEDAGEIRIMAFSPDGHWLAAAGHFFGELVQVWDVTNSIADPVVLSGHDEVVRAMAFSHNGRWLAIAGGLDKTASAVRVWDMDDLMADPVVLPGHEDAIVAVTFSRDDHWLATGSKDNTARVWDMKNPRGKAVVLRGHDSEITAMAFSHEGHWLVTGSGDSAIRLWDVPALLDPGVTNLAAEPVVLHEHEDNGESIISYAESGVGTDAVVSRTDDDVTALAFSRDGRWLVIGRQKKPVELWDMNDLTTDPIVLRNPKGRIGSIAFSLQDNWLATVGANMKNTVQVWDMANPTADPIVLPVQENRADTIVISPNGRWLTTGYVDSMMGVGVQLWDIDNLAAKLVPLHGETATNADTVAFSPDGHWLATALSWSFDLTVHLWDLANPAAAPYILEHEHGVAALTFSPDGRWLAIEGTNNAIQLWDMNNPTDETLIPIRHEGEITAMAFSPDGRLLATGDSDNIVRLWDMNDLASDPVILHGHDKVVGVMAFSPDGRLLATGDSDNIVRLWDMDNLTDNPVLSWSGDEITAMAFIPDGRWLATGSKDSFVRLWRLQLDELITLACRTASRNLTREEWQQSLGDRPYDRTCPDLPGPEERAAP